MVADLQGCRKLEHAKADQMFKRSFLQDCITLPNGCEVRKLNSSILREAELYFSKADYSNALLCYEKVLEKDPNNIFALLRKGCVLYAKGEPDIATAYYYQAINLTSAQDVEDLWKRCIANEKRKYLRFSQKARGNDDCFVLLSSYVLGLSRLYLLTGEFDLAEKILIKVKNLLQDRNRRDFQEACVLGGIGTYFLDSLNEHVSAEEYYERAVEILKELNLQKTFLFIVFQVKLGDIAFKNKSYPVAITRYEEAMGILSENK